MAYELLRAEMAKAESLSQALINVALSGEEAFDNPDDYKVFDSGKKETELQGVLDSIAQITNMPYRLSARDFLALDLAEGPCAPDDFNYYESKKWNERLFSWWNELKSL